MAPVTSAETSLFFFAADEDATSDRKYGLLLDAARFADDNGFAAVWTPERHFSSFGGPYSSPSVTGAALAMVTRRVKIRAGSVVVPLHDPIVIAEQWSIVDNLSSGRAGIACAPGWHVNDFALAPTRYEERVAEMHRGIDVIQNLWRGGATTRKNGAGREVEVRIRPRPVQSELPMWLAAHGDSTFVRAAERGFGVLAATHTLKDRAELANKIGMYRETFRRLHGLEGHVVLMAHAFVGEDDAHVAAVARPALARYLAANLGLQREYDAGRGSDRGFLGLDARKVEMITAFAIDSMIGGDLAFIGTGQRCRERAREFREIGVNEIACLIDFGIDPHEVLRSLARIRAEVM